MQFEVVSKNGTLCPMSKAVVPVNELEISYGFGVYEAVKIRNGKVYFLKQHLDRLLHSARCIDLYHNFSLDRISQYMQSLVSTIHQDSYNVKIVLYGGKTAGDAQLFLIPSAPYYPDRKWYREGVSVLSKTYERWMPQAKTLNMLASYCMYKEAQQKNAYDALLMSRKGTILEGTRTNVYLMKGKHIFSPPKDQILEGVTMMSLEKVIESSDFTLSFQELSYSAVFDFDGMFLSSTSSKLLPVRTIDTKSFPEITSDFLELMKRYDQALERSQGDFNLL